MTTTPKLTKARRRERGAHDAMYDRIGRASDRLDRMLAPDPESSKGEFIVGGFIEKDAGYVSIPIEHVERLLDKLDVGSRERTVYAAERMLERRAPRSDGSWVRISDIHLTVLARELHRRKILAGIIHWCRPPRLDDQKAIKRLLSRGTSEELLRSLLATRASADAVHGKRRQAAFRWALKMKDLAMTPSLPEDLARDAARKKLFAKLRAEEKAPSTSSKNKRLKRTSARPFDQQKALKKYKAAGDPFPGIRTMSEAWDARTEEPALDVLYPEWTHTKKTSPAAQTMSPETMSRAISDAWQDQIVEPARRARARRARKKKRS